VLKQAGYATGGYGKWGLGDLGTDGVPWKHGFDEFVGYLNQVHAHWYYPRFLFQNDQRLPLPGNENGKRTTYSHDVIAEKALAFIRRSKDKPFFCYMPVTIPHWELLVPEDSMAPYRGKVEETKPFITEKKHYADQPESHAAYAGMISRLDRDVGRVMSLLKELNLERDTIVFFTSDNGGAMRLHGDDYFQSYAGFRGNKQEMYEGGIRVPMIARWPGRIAAGKVSSFAWMFQDALPTLAEIGGCKPPAGIDGVSVLPTLLGKTQKPHEFLYWEQPRYIAKTGDFQQEKPAQAVRMGEWKAVRPKANQPLELYNLKDDIGEKNNLAAKRPEVMARIERYLATARTEPLRQTDPNLGYWDEK
jgi:arylsulfatase A